MIAARFRLIAWVAGCALAALICYMASQSVAAERGALARVDGEIADTQNDIRRLETEIAARSRMGQLERWNQLLALQAARPAQYVANEIQLASYARDHKLPLDPAIMASHGAVNVVSYQQPAPAGAAAPQPAPPQQQQPAAPAIQAPMLRQATYVRPKPSRLNDDGDDAAPIVKAALEKPAAAPKVSKPARISLASFELPAPDPAPARHKAKADDALLPSDLGAMIAAEKKGPRR